MQGLFLFAGLFSVLAFLVPTGLLLGLLVVFALRAEPDDAGGRASALYLSMASFVALFTLLAAAFALTSSVVDLVAGDMRTGGGWSAFPPDGATSFDEGGGSTGFDDPGGDFGAFRPEGPDGQDADDRAISAAVASGIVALVAGGILAFHLPRLDRLGAAHQAGTSAWRVRRSFRLVTCLTAVLIVLVTASLALYGVYSVAAPGVAGAGDRGDALEGLVPVLVLLGGAGLVFRLHWDDERPPPVTSAVAP